MYQVLDIFSGIGGFSLGLERTGKFQTVAFAEIDEYCNKVLSKHWPTVRRYNDVKEITKRKLQRDGIYPTVICAGIPCQDISLIGKGAGITGKRSGIWSECARLIGEIRPEYAVLENVAALRGRGLDRVLGDLASLRYDAVWNCIAAEDIGAPHRRDRIWIIAYPAGTAGKNVADTLSQGLALWKGITSYQAEELSTAVRDGGRAIEPCVGRGAHGLPAQLDGRLSDLNVWPRLPIDDSGQEAWEQGISRIDTQAPHRVDRIRALGNSLVPQIAEMIGRSIIDAEVNRN